MRSVMAALGGEQAQTVTRRAERDAVSSPTRQVDREGTLSRRSVLGVVGAGMTGAITSAFVRPAQPAFAGASEAEVVLGPGGGARSVKDGSLGAPAAVGDGVADDTPAFQAHLSALTSAGGGVLFVPMGRYKISSTLSLSERVHLVGESDPRAAKGYTGHAATTLISHFTGTLIEVVGSHASLRNLLVLNGGALAENASPGVASLRIASKMVTVAGCMIYRQGLAALVLEQGSGGAQIIGNRIIANSKQGERTTESHGVLLQNGADSLITENDISADGTAVLSQGGAANVITGNFIYNATYGIQLIGQGWNTVTSNRVDEHDRAGIVIDSGSRSNVVSGNSMLLNGVDSSAPPMERAGLVIGSGSNGISPPTANAITGNTFSNRTNGNKVRTQQYGVVMKAGTSGNLVSANTFLDQRVASILDQSSGTNTVTANAVVDEGT